MLTARLILHAFLRAIGASRVALIGAVTTGVLFPVLLVYSVLDGLGFVDSPRWSFVVYGALTWVFVLGHLMVFLGLFVLRNRKDTPLFTADELRKYFAESGRFRSVRKFAVWVTVITGINVAIISVSAYNGFHYSESVDFCARLCHSVMAPELTAYGNSPHSRVACVECHIGEGARWFVRSKLSGVRQLVAVALDTYSQPIETPIHGLRPARETCQECHRPELFHRERLSVIDKFLEDEDNTHVETVLLMKVGAGDAEGQDAHGSHWHVSENRKIVYEHTDRARVDIRRVTLIDTSGREETFAIEEQGESTGSATETRLMDCLDCHNRPTHVYLSPGEALDRKLISGEIPTELPYVKKKGMELIQADYGSLDPVEAIGKRLRAWYAENYPDLSSRSPAVIEHAVDGVTRAYAENVFPEMKIGFNTYPRHLGHWHGEGCFRCHDDRHRSTEGRVISQDCELCHLILVHEEPVGAPSVNNVETGDAILQMLQRAGEHRGHEL